MMLPKMLEDLLKQEENVEDLRAKFLEADVDQSGTLTIDELYSVLLKMGLITSTMTSLGHLWLKWMLIRMESLTLTSSST